MDIRSYFSSNRKPTSTVKSGVSEAKTKQANSRKIRSSKILDSDSDDESTADHEIKTKAAVKTYKRILNSSDESENDTKSKKYKTTSRKEKKSVKRSKGPHISDSSSEGTSPPTKKMPIVQRKIGSPKIISKFFKETSAASVFGENPVQRKNNSKLDEIQTKLRFKTKQREKMDDDAFKATLQQMDEIGDDWVDWNALDKLEKNQPVKEAVKAEEPEPKKKEADDNKKDLLNAVPSKKPSLTKSSLNVCNADSGFESQSTMSSDSQNTDAEVLESIKHGSSKSEMVLNDNRQSETSSIISKNTLVSMRQFRFSDSDTSGIKTIRSSKSSDVAKFITSLPVSQLSKMVSTNQIIKEKEKADSFSSKRSSGSVSVTSVDNVSSDDYLLWVERHKPQSSKKIIGQQGDKSNVRKLTDWLSNWYKNNANSKKANFVPNGWNKDPTGACFKAALLSGPPGVGKTTSVSLVCQELGFDMVEFNASDTRSKKLLQDEVGKLLKNTSLTPYFSRGDQKESVTKKRVLVMDEVDGMAGNEDRGGIQELIQLIKTTKIPIICMCNDRNHPKIRSLVNYCFDLRFSRPRVEQIKGYMRSVCFKEKLDITSETLTDIITSANNDVRLILNHLSMLAADKSDLEASQKYVKLGPWDVLRKVFSKEDHKNMTIHDKCDLFFYDYNIAPLFVQENYLSVKPLNINNNKSKKMELYARAADCISIGDKIDNAIRCNSAWSLLPIQAVFSSYAPGEYLEGYCSAQINFPSWLGKNSKRARLDRLLQEIQIHTRLKLSASKESINLDYASYLRDSIIRPLVNDGTDGVKDALDKLHGYELMKEDLDSLQEICQWPNSTNLMHNLDSKVKAAFTRMYNKNPPVRPYSLTAPIKRKIDQVDEMTVDEEEDDNEKSDDETDAMIVTKKKQMKKNETSAPSTSKDKTQANKKIDAGSASKAKVKGRKK